MSDQSMALPILARSGECAQLLKISAGGPISKHDNKGGDNMKKTITLTVRSGPRILVTPCAALSVHARAVAFAS